MVSRLSGRQVTASSLPVLRNLAKGAVRSEAAWPEVTLWHDVQMHRLSKSKLNMLKKINPTKRRFNVGFAFMFLAFWEIHKYRMKFLTNDQNFLLPSRCTEQKPFSQFENYPPWFWIQFILSHSPPLCIISAIANRMQWLSWTEEFLWQT